MATFIGDGSANTINGTVVDDFIDGGGGDDTISPGFGVDEVHGGAGNDTLAYALSTVGVSVFLLDPDDDTFIGCGGFAEDDFGDGIEHVTGSNFGDLLHGNIAGNVLNGGSGNDVIFS